MARLLLSAVEHHAVDVPTESDMRVLVVDDDRAVLRSLEILLSERGHEVRCVDDPLRFDEVARSMSPDVLILDLMLSGTTGLDLVRRFRSSDRQDVHVILVSGHSDQVEKLNLASHGIAAFVPKPIDFERLARLIESAPAEPQPRERSL